MNDAHRTRIRSAAGAAVLGRSAIMPVGAARVNQGTMASGSASLVIGPGPVGLAGGRRR